MKKQIVVASVLALLVCPNYITPAQANPIAAPLCKDIPSCGVAGIVIGTEVIGGILYYIVKNAAGAVRSVRSKQRQIPAHRTNETNEQHEEKFSTTTTSARCYELAKEETARTGKKWRVKANKPIRGSGGVSKPGYLLQWECTITTAPPEQ